MGSKIRLPKTARILHFLASRTDGSKKMILLLADSGRVGKKVFAGSNSEESKGPWHVPFKG